jgi:hypothetical protein
MSHAVASYIPAAEPVFGYEHLDAKGLSGRWKLPASWIRYHTTQGDDPIPHIKFGKYVRYQWGHPALAEWLERRRKAR